VPCSCLCLCLNGEREFIYKRRNHDIVADVAYCILHV
jgi:hypothetical protein